MARAAPPRRPSSKTLCRATVGTHLSILSAPSPPCASLSRLRRLASSVCVSCARAVRFGSKSMSLQLRKPHDKFRRALRLCIVRPAKAMQLRPGANKARRRRHTHVTRQARSPRATRDYHYGGPPTYILQWWGKSMANAASRSARRFADVVTHHARGKSRDRRLPALARRRDRCRLLRCLPTSRD